MAEVDDFTAFAPNKMEHDTSSFSLLGLHGNLAEAMCRLSLGLSATGMKREHGESIGGHRASSMRPED